MTESMTSQLGPSSGDSPAVEVPADLIVAFGELTEYGFKWGPMEVTRMAEISGSLNLSVKTVAGLRIQIFVSPKGHSLRVFREGKELT